MHIEIYNVCQIIIFFSSKRTRVFKYIKNSNFWLQKNVQRPCRHLSITDILLRCYCIYFLELQAIINHYILFFLDLEVQFERLDQKVITEGHLERPTRNIELEGFLKRLNWRASSKGCLKRQYQKAISNGHVERLNWMTGLKGWLESTYFFLDSEVQLKRLYLKVVS